MVNRELAYSLIAVCLLLSTSFVQAAQVTLSPRLTLSEEYTDNVFRTKDNTAEDWIFRLTPGATLDILGRKAGLSISYDASYAEYHNFSEQSQWSHRAGLDAFAQFSKSTRGYLNNAFIYTEDPGVYDSISGRQGRDPYYVNTTSIGVTNRFGARDYVNLQYIHREFIDTAAVADDSTLYTPALDFAWWFARKWGLTGDLAHTRGFFELSDDYHHTRGNIRLVNDLTRRLDGSLGYEHIAVVYDQGLNEDYRVYYPSVGIDYTHSPDTRASLQLGYLWRDYEDYRDDAGWTLFGEAETGLRFRHGSLGIAWSSGLDFDYGSTENLGLYYFSGAGATAAWQINATISADLSGAYRYVEYVDLNPDRVDHIAGAGVGLAWAAAPWCNLRLNYGHQNRDSTDENWSYVENRVTFSVSFAPQRPVSLWH